jgi:iron complex outermembrane receptor protein
MIERLPTSSIADAIARALGADVQQRSPAQSDLSLRGSTTEQVLVLIDGVPVNDTQTGHFHLDQAVPLDQVERIEVMRGAGSSLYGSSAVGGIVNIVTRANGRQSSARIEGGTFGTVLMSATAGTRLRDVAPLTLGIEHDLSDGHRPGTDYRNTIARASLLLPAGGGMLRMDAGDAHRAFGAAQFYAPFPTAYEETKVLTGNASYDRSFGRLRIEPRASIRKHYDDFVLKKENPAFYHNIHTTTDAGGGIVMRAPVGLLDAALGGETFHSTITSTNLKNHSETRSAVFGEAVAGGVNRVTASAGMRVDHSSTFGDFYSPSFAAGFPLGDRLRLKASAARSFRAPTWTDRYYHDPANLGDSTLRVERAWSYETSVEIAPAAHWRAEVSGFVRDVDNAIDWIVPVGAPAGTPFQIVNIQKATFRGAELRLTRSDLAGIHLTARGSILSFDADSAAGFRSKYALRPLTETASLEAVTFLPIHVRLAAMASYARRPGDGPYTLIDAQVSHVWHSFEGFLGGTNLGNDHYIDVSGVPSAGRALRAGLRWHGGER